MSEPEWLDVDIVLDVHAEQLALFDGLMGCAIGNWIGACAAVIIRLRRNDIAAWLTAYDLDCKKSSLCRWQQRAAFASVIVFPPHGIDSSSD